MHRRAWYVVAALTVVVGAAVLVLQKLPADAGAARSGPAQPAPTVWIDVGWAGGDVGSPPGPRDGRLGRLDGNESAPEGPMSFTVSPFGELFVLDQVNERLAVYDPDGSFSHALSLPASTFQDVEVTDKGHLVVLDRLARRSLLVMAPDGRILAEEPIEGEALPEGGMVTGMFAEDDGLWLEVGNAYRVHCLDSRHGRGSRETRSGRPSGEPRTVVGAALDGAGGAALWLEDHEDGTIFAERKAFFSREMARIVWVEADVLGRLYAAFHLWSWQKDDPGKVAHEETVIWVLDHWLGLVTELRSPHVATRWEQFRELKVSEDGVIHQLALSPDGARLLRWRGSW